MFLDFIEIFILSLIQGISEFLPVSSSAHLIVISTLYKFKANSMLIDVSLHLGSLTAIVYYFRKELLDLKKNKKILKLIIIGSVPIMIFGYIIYITELIYLLRNIKVIAWTTLIFGLVLYIADKNDLNKKISSDLKLSTILFIGFFQVLSLIPGVSRAGITITAGRILNFNRADSAKISFLLSIPALAGASFLSLKNIHYESIEFNYLVLSSIIFSFIFSYLTIKFFLDYIKKFSLNIFVIYRVMVAIILFILIYS
tara:strand:- start:6388 stop:7155 length:768 start_codon:yes stop_codon:yes gene_type:complete